MNNYEFAILFLNNKYRGKSDTGTTDIVKLSDMFLEDVIEILRALFNAEAASLFAINHTSEEIYALKSAGAGTEDLNKITIKFGIGIVGHTVKDKTCIISNNPENDIRFNRGFDRKTGFKTRNLLSYPVILNDKIVSVIEIINKKSDFSESDKEILNHIFNGIKELFQVAITNNSYLRK
ncbi:MAG: GAF domain-containing protein [Deltaproteobacteria bacterium]|nr:GAF domain-containing protein [Deltaproteobacteria bacterium]